jgi:DNA repair exonuclease SbcCD nuclease subunit
MINPLGILADVHLGYRQYGLKERELDFQNVFCNAIGVAADLDVYRMAIAGDFLDSKRPSSRLIMWLMDLQAELEEMGMCVDVMDGNHDGCKPSWIEIIAKVAKMDKGFLSVNNDSTTVGEGDEYDYTVKFCPHFDADAVIKWCEEADPCEVLLLHLPVQQFIGYPSKTALDLERLPKDKFEYVFIGDTHVNATLDIGGTTYISPGSTEMNDVSEPAEKFIYFVYRDEAGGMNHRREPLKNRPVVDLTIETESDLDEAIAKIKSLTDKNINPIIRGHYLGEVPDTLKRLKTVVDHDKVINRLQCLATKTHIKYAGSKQEHKKLCDYVVNHINKDAPEYSLAYAIATDSEDPASHIHAYIAQREMELKSA